jgi:hypothetical protein
MESPSKSEMLDITAPLENINDIEITIRKDGKVVWINAEGYCLFRICQIPGRIIIKDERKGE